MATSFWGSLQHKGLVSKERLAELHAADKARGLTEDQLQQLYVYFTDYMQQVARLAQTERQQLLRMRVVGTAAVYFRKLYCRNANDFATHDPRSLSLACLFLASKTEEAPIHAKLLLHYARRLAAKAGVPAPGDTHMLVAAEALLVEQLDCDLLVFSPHASLSRLLADALPATLSEGARAKAVTTAWSLLNDSYRTPLHLVYPPHVVALGCLHLMSVLRRIDLRAWLEGLQTDLNQVYDVCSEMLELYEKHRQPIDTPTCLRYLEVLGLPAVLQPVPPPSPPRQAAAGEASSAAGGTGAAGGGAGGQASAPTVPQFSFPRPTG